MVGSLKILRRLDQFFSLIPYLRESSFNMTRGDEDIEGGSENF